MSNKVNFSFEYFPPKTERGRETFWTHVDKLAALNPSFMTITYGAGGSTRDWTLSMAADLAKRSAIPIASHLTAVGTSKRDLQEIANTLWNSGVKHIVALRGDNPKDPAVLEKIAGMDCHHYANELVAALLEIHPFEISVGAYPEKHPEAETLEADISYLKAKCDAGSTRAISQFFFDNDNYYRFVDQAKAAGIDTPIVPGLLPIMNFEKMLSFAKSCDAQVPQWMHDKFAGLEDKPEEAAKIAEDVLIEQCRDLVDHGIEHVHFYTLNQSAMIIRTLEALNLTPS